MICHFQLRCFISKATQSGQAFTAIEGSGNTTIWILRAMIMALVVECWALVRTSQVRIPLLDWWEHWERKKETRTRSYKNIFSVDIRYAGILALWLAENGHVTFISQKVKFQHSINLRWKFLYRIGSCRIDPFLKRDSSNDTVSDKIWDVIQEIKTIPR